MEIITHKQIWAAIDEIARRKGYSVSGLAKNSGLDSTAFNKSKRITAKGKERWPSTESIAKVLRLTETSIDEFLKLVASKDHAENEDQKPWAPQSLPLLDTQTLSEWDTGDNGLKVDVEQFHAITGFGPFPNGTLAIRISAGTEMSPVCREGDVIIVDPNCEIEPGNRVVLKTRKGEIFKFVLDKQNRDNLMLKSDFPEGPSMLLLRSNIEWIAKVLWISQ